MAAFLGVLLIHFGATTAMAQDSDAGPFARARLEPSASVTVGEPITVLVEVFVPSFFSGAPRFPDLDVPDALVIFNDRGVNLSERIGGRSWAGQSRSYTIYPQRAGAFDIEAIDVQVTYNVRGAGRTTATVSPEPLRFEATVPEAARDLDYFIATTSLRVQETTDHDDRTLMIGESLTRTVTVTVDDALSMVIPPLDLGAPVGLAAYPAPPLVDDSGGERGERIVGTRTQSTTFVAETEGRYTLPPVELSWWDVGTEELRSARVEAIDIEVVANPGLVNEFGVPGEDDVASGSEMEDRRRISLFETARRYGLPLLLLLAAVLVIDRIARRYGVDTDRWLRGDEDAREEKRLFREFRRAARDHRAADTARTFMRWLDHRNRRPATYAAFSAAANDTVLDREARVVGACVYGRPTDAPRQWSGSTLADRVEQARRDAHEKRHDAPVGTSLPRLNP